MRKIGEAFRKNLNSALTGYGARTRLCERTGISQAILSRYLKGETVPGLDAVERIADGLGVSVSDLLRSDDPPSDEQVVRDLVANWVELKARAKGDEDYELFEIVDKVLRYYFERRKKR